MYLDYAENQARRQNPMTMKEWINKLDGFLVFNEYAVLKDGGSVTAEIGKTLAESQFEQFRIIQDKEYESDFDATIKKLEQKKKTNN